MHGLAHNLSWTPIAQLPPADLGCAPGLLAPASGSFALPVLEPECSEPETCCCLPPSAGNIAENKHNCWGTRAASSPSLGREAAKSLALPTCFAFPSALLTSVLLSFPIDGHVVSGGLPKTELKSSSFPA